MKNTVNETDKKRANLSVFNLMLPTILIILASYIKSTNLADITTVTMIQLLLLIWQWTSVKTFVETIYK